MVLTMSMHVLHKAVHQMQRQTDFWASLVAINNLNITPMRQAYRYCICSTYVLESTGEMDQYAGSLASGQTLCMSAGTGVLWGGTSSKMTIGQGRRLPEDGGISRPQFTDDMWIFTCRHPHRAL